MSEEFIKVTDTQTDARTEPLPELLSELKKCDSFTTVGSTIQRFRRHDVCPYRDGYDLAPIWRKIVTLRQWGVISAVHDLVSKC